jgi:3-oxoacyl-[acyl-carrier-protein] synthase III
MSGWWNQRSPLTRLLVYAVAAIMALVMAVSVGAVAALVVRGNLSLPAGERSRSGEPSPAGERGKPPQRQQANADCSQQENSDATRGQAASQDKQTAYVHEVGEIQANSVETFLDSHEKVLRYDALTSGDIEKMQANQAALQKLADQASRLGAPQKYRDQKDAFVSAIDELHQAAHLAYTLAADPISATQADFDSYDRLVNEAGAGLQQSNEILGKDYKTIEGVRSVSTSS